MPYITVYSLPFNSNCRILSAELNCTFTIVFTKIGEKILDPSPLPPLGAPLVVASLVVAT